MGEGIGGGIRENMVKKAMFYADRIEATRAGKPLFQGDENKLQQLLIDYSGMSGLPYHRLYNIDFPNWLSPNLNEVTSDQQLQRITDILTNFNNVLAQEPDPQFLRQIHFSMDPDILGQTFDIQGLEMYEKRHEEPNIRGGGTHTVVDRYLSRLVTPEDLQKISDKLTPVGWHAVNLDISGNQIQFNLERNHA